MRKLVVSLQRRIINDRIEFSVEIHRDLSYIFFHNVIDHWVGSGSTHPEEDCATETFGHEFAVEGFSWMPDGRIIFASQDGNHYAVNQDGSGRTRLTPDDSPNWDPSVCGDGRYIVYVAYREQKRGVWRMNADGSNLIRVADETFAISPQCFPNGKSVV